jgi:polyisoprenoid-binding protein YceI
MGAKLAHDLILSPSNWRGTLNVDADNPAASSAELTIEARSIQILEAVGGVMSLSDKDKGKIAKNMEDDVLQAGKFPQLTFASTSVSGAAPNFNVAGTMTIRGTGRPVNVAVSVNGSQVTARASISQKDFGIKPFSAMMGAIKLRDDVDFELTVDLPSA